MSLFLEAALAELDPWTEVQGIQWVAYDGSDILTGFRTLSEAMERADSLTPGGITWVRAQAPSYRWRNVINRFPWFNGYGHDGSRWVVYVREAE